jgi:hypothetical protein
MAVSPSRTLRSSDEEWDELKKPAAEAGQTVKAFLATKAGVKVRGHGRPLACRRYNDEGRD